MTHEEQIAHWKERALIAERALDDLYNRARDYAAPVGSGRIMIEDTGGHKIRTVKAIRDSTGKTLKVSAAIVSGLPRIVIDRSGRLADALRALNNAGYGVVWHHV